MKTNILIAFLFTESLLFVHTSISNAQSPTYQEANIGWPDYTAKLHSNVVQTLTGMGGIVYVGFVEVHNLLLIKYDQNTYDNLDPILSHLQATYPRYHFFNMVNFPNHAYWKQTDDIK